jgi:hypothetical protein
METPRSVDRGVFFRRKRASVLFLVTLFFLPHGEFAGTRQSGFNTKARQNPTIENVPGGNYASQKE